MLWSSFRPESIISQCSLTHNRTSAERARLGTSRSATQRRKQSPNHESRKHHSTGARSGPAVDVPERQALRQLAAARALRVRAAGPVRVPIEKHVRDEWHHRGIPSAADQGRAPLHPAEPPRGQAPLEARPLLGPSSERGRVRTLRHNHRELAGSFRTETPFRELLSTPTRSQRCRTLAEVPLHVELHDPGPTPVSEVIVAEAAQIRASGARHTADRRHRPGTGTGLPTADRGSAKTASLGG